MKNCSTDAAAVYLERFFTQNCNLLYMPEPCGFFFSASPIHPQAVLPPPALVPRREGGTLACGRGGWGSQFGRRDRHSGTVL
jgi:hypothetical protein